MVTRQTQRKFNRGDVVKCVDSKAVEEHLTAGKTYMIKINDKLNGQPAVNIQKDDCGKNLLVLERHFVKATDQEIATSAEQVKEQI